MKDFTDSNGDLKDMSTIFGLLQDKMKGMSGKERNDVFHMLFGTTGQAAGGILVSNSAALKKLNDETENSYKNNYMGKLADKNQESAKQQLKIFKATLDSISMTLAKDWLPVVTDMAKKLNGWLQNIDKLSDGHKKLLTGIALGIPTFTLLSGALSAVLKIIGGFGKVGVGMLNFLGAGRSKATQQTESVIALTASINNLTRATEEYNLTGGLKTTSPTASSVIPRGSKSSPVKTINPIPNSVAVEQEVTGSLGAVSKSGKVASTATKVGRGIGGKLVVGLGAALAVWDVGSSIYDAVQSDKSKAKIKSASKIAGTLIGGGIGAMIAGPAGAMIGASIGDQIGSTKTAQKITEALKKQFKALNKRYGKGGAVTIGVSPQVKVNKPKLAKQFKEKAKGLGAQFAKIDDLNIKLGMATNKKDREKVKKEIDDLYKHIGKSADDSVKKRTKSEKAFLDQQYKDGLINKKQHDDLVKNLNESDKKRVENNKYDLDALKNNTKVTNDSIASLEKLHSNAVSEINKKASSKRKKLKKDEASALASIEGAGFVEINGKFYKGEKGRQQVADLYAKKRKDLAKDTSKKLANQEKNDSKARTGVIKDMAKARVAQEKKLGIDIAGSMTSSSKKQKSILNQLKSAKGKISEKMAQKLINDSAKATNRQIKDAENERKKTVAAAKKKRNETVEHAKWMYKNVDGYTKDQMNNAIKHANSERDVTIAAAKEKKKQTVNHAKKQNEDVVKEAASESKSVSTHAMRSGENGVYAWRKHTGGLWDVWNWISSTWNWIAKALGGNSMKAPKDKPTQGKPTWKVGAYATGGRGNGLALVGEAGPELAYEPYSGSARILGAKGAQLANVKASEYILDAEKTQRVLNGSYEGKLPAYAGGKVANFLTSAVEKVKDFTGDISDKVQGVLDGPEKAIKGILGKFKISGLGSNGNSWMKGIKNASKDLFINAIKKIADALTAGGKFDGKIGPHGVYDYLWKVAQRTMKKYGMTVKSGYRPGDQYYHGKHQAIDIGWAPSRNGDRAYKKVADWVFNTFPKQVAYVITQGQVRDRKGLSGQPAIGRWEHWPDNDHYDHLHINGMWGPSDIGSGGKNPSGSGVQRWRSYVKKALKMNGVSASSKHVNAWLSQIQTESGGNPGAIQGYIPGDPNNGNPARGLLQTIPSTFRANAFSRHGNIMNGFDNILAAIRYAIKRYGKSGMYGVIGHGHGYANGGIINKNQMIEVAEGNMPEAVVPLTKGSRAWKLLQSIINHYAGNELVNQVHDTPVATQDTQGLKNISDKIDILINLMTQLVGGQKGQIKATYDTAWDQNKMYNKQALDRSIMDTQLIGN